jgi:Family of unknown function (DUF6519)/Abnormal spindle-like microcephaly-assoc'd, ASPM-SPD-2-Hydin
MGSDISRSTFVPAKHYSGVRQQQGRVNLDADWNEQVDIAAHRVGTETIDIIGTAGAPRDNAGFSIQSIPQGSPFPWAANTAFAQGDVVVDSNGGVEVAVTAGTSGASQPTWATAIGAAPVTDGTTGLTWQLVASDLTISPGRIYVDGLLCELDSDPLSIVNFNGDGTAAAGTQAQVATLIADGSPLATGQWVLISAQGSPVPTPLLVQITSVNAAANSLTFGTNVSGLGSPNTNPQLQRITTYATQLDYPSAPPVPASGTSLVYLDVWERNITSLEDPHIQEIALGGPDTATRMKTVWQVKLVDVSSAGNVVCATPDSEITPWEQIIQPSAGLLTNGIVQSSSSGPCCLTPNTGYTGMENQLYRVEIHQPGPIGTATFKWSRDDASIATSVTAINPTANSTGASTSQLTVLNTGRDAVLSFSPGDWIEITDDYLELDGSAGELHQIDTNGVDPTRQTITLQTPVSAAFLSRFNSSADYHTRICKWDQSGNVFQSDNTTVWTDLNASAAGDIEVPPAGTSLILENGITVSFDVTSPGGSFRAGDYWTFAARTADGSIEQLAQVQPLGIRHHYCRLGIINFGIAGSPSIPWIISDCRRVFPPLADPCIHVTDVFVSGIGRLANDSTLTVQSLGGGLSVVCDAPIDPVSVTQPNSTVTSSALAQATCFVTVGVPVLADQVVVGFNPLVLPATVSLDATQTTINLVPSNAAVTALATQITSTCPTLLANLTLKGDFIWESGNTDVHLDGGVLGTPYSDADGQHTGLQLPSGQSQRSSDFGMWFWLTSTPTISVSPASLDFGNQLVGSASSAQSVTVTNNTAEPVTTSISISPAGDFAETDTCGGTVGANSSCTISVTFAPTAQGSRAAAMTITAGDSSYVIALTGNGVSPALTASPGALNFGFHTQNTTSAPLTVTVTNSGNAPLSVMSISTTSSVFTASYVLPLVRLPFVPISEVGLMSRTARTKETLPINIARPVGSPIFNPSPVTSPILTEPILTQPILTQPIIAPVSPVIPVATEPIFTLQPGGSATISVQFSPVALGAVSATLNIASDAPGSPLQVSLSGTSLQKGKEIIIDKLADKITDKIRDVIRPSILKSAGRNKPGPASQDTQESQTQKAFIRPEERPQVGKRPVKPRNKK